MSAGPTGIVQDKLVKREPGHGHHSKSAKHKGTGAAAVVKGNTDSSSSLSTGTSSNAATAQTPPQGTTCDQWGKFSAPQNLTLYNNKFGQNAGNGSQCLNLHAVDPYLSWSTDWDWANNPDQVKSYPNAVWQSSTGKKLSETGSIEASWSYEYSGMKLDADVAIDIFTSASADEQAPMTTEVMIWLGQFGSATPIGMSIVPGPIPLGNNTYELWHGMNKNVTVYTFVAADARKTKNSFHGDIMWFVRYLISGQYISGDEVLRSIGAGTETFTGSQAKFAVDKYAVKEV